MEGLWWRDHDRGVMMEGCRWMDGNGGMWDGEKGMKGWVWSDHGGEMGTECCGMERLG